MEDLQEWKQWQKKIKKMLDINVTERFIMNLRGGMQDGIYRFETGEIGRDQPPDA
jgi:hypothetical protein